MTFILDTINTRTSTMKIQAFSIISKLQNHEEIGIDNMKSKLPTIIKMKCHKERRYTMISQNKTEIKKYNPKGEYRHICPDHTKNK